MSLAQSYESAVRHALTRAADATALLPLALVQACVDVLPIDGASLSLTQELRVPLSATSEVVARAERLQVTLGEGPCLSAVEEPAPLVADLTAMRSRWPVFHSELVQQTPFRSVASLPVLLPDSRRLGAVDLYSTDELAAPFAVVAEAGMEIADRMAAYLLATSAWWAEEDALSSTNLAAGADRRLNVWVAVGMVIGHRAMTNADALAVLRAYAFAHELTLDDLAEQVTTHTLAVAALVD